MHFTARPAVLLTPTISIDLFDTRRAYYFIYYVPVDMYQNLLNPVGFYLQHSMIEHSLRVY